MLVDDSGKELPLEWVLYRFWVLSKYHFGDNIGEAMWHNFLHYLVPCEYKLTVVQIDIGWVWDPKYYYQLDLANTVPIRA